MLTVAVFLGHTEMVEMLVGEGADVNQRNGDQGTALHSAAFVGRSKEAVLLLNAGADPTLKDANGQTAKDLLQIDFGTTNFIATSFGNPLDEDELRTGRADIAKQLGVQNEIGSGAEGATGPGWQTLKALLFQFPVFMHLWFLWFLCWLVAAFTIYAPLAKALKTHKLPKWLISSPVSLLWLVPLTMVPQCWMSSSSFGPDSSIGLLPIPSVLAYYAVFFFFGALYWDADDSEGRLGRNWAPLAKALKTHKLPKWLISSPFSLLWLVPLTMIPQCWMGSFGPDSSIGLLPIPSVLAYYAVFFFLALWDADDSETRGAIGRSSCRRSGWIWYRKSSDSCRHSKTRCSILYFQTGFNHCLHGS